MGKFIEYMKQFKKLTPLGKTIKAAVISSFTVKGFSEVLKVRAHEANLNLEVYEGAYKQHNQEILNREGALYSFDPDIVFVLIDFNDIAGEYSFDPYAFDVDGRKSFIDSKKSEMLNLISALKSRLNNSGVEEGFQQKIIVFNNFLVPSYSPLGVLENKHEYGFFESVRDLNYSLEREFREDRDVYIFDLNIFASKIGYNNFINPKLYYMGDIKIDLDAYPYLAGEYMAYIKAFMFMTKKCIVLDLDNTLWGGVVGEDGISGIKLSPDGGGKVFYEFQKRLKALLNRGIILAINSKNNLEDVKEVLRDHPYMILREEHFSYICANWCDKATNIREIAGELNIGTDSMVYVDDDRLNREIVKSELPEVLTLDMPEDIVLYDKILKDVNDFNTFTITKEDRNKYIMYNARRQRKELESDSVDLDGYLRNLCTKVIFVRANSSNTARIAQLTQKTNQFNLTVKRYTESFIEKLVSGGYFVYCVCVTDKFGDNGISGVLIYYFENEKIIIDNFLLSCRILGRGIEKAVLDFIFQKSLFNNKSSVVGELVFTPKNVVVRDFYKNNGFTLTSETESKEVWIYSMPVQGDEKADLVGVCPSYIAWEEQNDFS